MLEYIFIRFIKKPLYFSLVFLLLSLAIISILNNLLFYDNHRYSNYLMHIFENKNFLNNDLKEYKLIKTNFNLTIDKKEISPRFFTTNENLLDECVFFNFWIKKNIYPSETSVFFPAVWIDQENTKNIKSYIKFTKDNIEFITSRRQAMLVSAPFLNSQNWHMITFYLTKNSFLKPREILLFIDANLMGNSYLDKNSNKIGTLKFLNVDFKDKFQNNSIMMKKLFYSNHCLSKSEIKHLYRYDKSGKISD